MTSPRALSITNLNLIAFGIGPGCVTCLPTATGWAGPESDILEITSSQQLLLVGGRVNFEDLHELGPNLGHCFNSVLEPETAVSHKCASHMDVRVWSFTDTWMRSAQANARY